MNHSRPGRLIVAMALLAAACGGEGTSLPDSPPETATMTTVSTTPPVSVGAPHTPTTAPSAAGQSSSSIADAIVALGSAELQQISVTTRAPVAISIGDIDVVDAPIEPVGVTVDGEYEVPGGDAVGWYEFGPAPGETGSAVLAAHIAFDGVDGVFRHLDDLEVGEQLTIAFDDGTTSSWVISERAQYGKNDLPFERIFSRTGEPTLALITCGGAFDRTARSYLDNVVAYAVPLDDA